MSQLGNAVRELAPGTTWKVVDPGTNLADLIWLDDPFLRPDDTQILQKMAELDAQPLQQNDVKHLRQMAYMSQSDPIFFLYQRGDATEQEWLDAVEAVKAQFPYPA